MRESRTEFQIAAKEAVFAAWFSEWNANTYRRRTPFREQPCFCNTGSTGGAPVILGDGFLVGLLRECDAWVEWTGCLLTADAPEGALFFSNAASEEDRWKEYHQALKVSFRSPLFGKMPEYCTWVEQNYRCLEPSLDAALQILSPELVESYLETVQTADWPAGRFTVDAGWSSVEGPGGFGDWQPRMDMPTLAAKIRQAGHIPGLWMAPALIHPQSRIAQQYPEILGNQVDMGGECVWSRFHFAVPSEITQTMIQDLFFRAFEWGFRKFKLDLFYGPKPVMREFSAQCRMAADSLPEPVELEGHIPDPFCAQYMDVIRINDLLISPKHPNWRNVLDGHLYVCRNSAPGMVLNLDHVGGNRIDVDEASFIEHVARLKENADIGYPALSLLPQHVGVEAVKAVADLLGV